MHLAHGVFISLAPMNIPPFVSTGPVLTGKLANSIQRPAKPARTTGARRVAGVGFNALFSLARRLPLRLRHCQVPLSAG